MRGRIAKALEVLTRELITSHGRCHYPYILTSGPCTLQGPNGPSAGVFITIESEVFGRVASASEPTWEAALSRVCQELDETREDRLERETQWAAEQLRNKEPK